MAGDHAISLSSKSKQNGDHHVEEKHEVELVQREAQGNQEPTGVKEDSPGSTNEQVDKFEVAALLPFGSKKHEQPEQNEDQVGEDEVQEGMLVTNDGNIPDGEKKKKKKSKRSKAKRGLKAPTGMEEFFADAPLTPAEYEEEKNLYHPDLSFVDRILTAMQKFERTRKLSSERRDVFYKWLHYGGIVIGPSYGTGGHDLKSLDKDETAAVLSQASIPDELRTALETTNTDDAKYEVDFGSCTKGFLSRSASDLYAFDRLEDASLVTTTIERFLDYLLQHDVCPEYNEQILSTRDFCREANLELWDCAEAGRLMPGQFNVACSTLAGGQYANYDGETDWGNNDPSQPVFVGLSQEEAETMIRFAVLNVASEPVYQHYYQLVHNGDDLEVVETIHGQGFEIVDIVAPTADCKDFYKQNSTTFRPMGKVIAKPWTNPDSPPEDLTQEEMDEVIDGVDNDARYEFFVEEIIQQHMSINQKVVATIHKLNCGIWFFDEVARVLPDFDVWLFNDLVEDYKEPRWLKGAYVPGAPDWKQDLDDKIDQH